MLKRFRSLKCISLLVFLTKSALKQNSFNFMFKSKKSGRNNPISEL